MGKVYRHYTKEFKEEACRLVNEDKLPVSLVAEKQLIISINPTAFILNERGCR